MKHYFRIIGVVIFCTTLSLGAHVEVKNVTSEIQPRFNPFLNPSSSTTSSPLSSPECSCNVNSDIDPVCGSDRKTYFNRQQLECLSKCNNPDLQYLYNGPCLGQTISRPTLEYGIPYLEKPQKECLCDIDVNERYELYCGNDGVTYYSQTTMKCIRKCFNPKLEVNYRGVCDNEKQQYPVVYQQEPRPPCFCSIPFKAPQLTCGSNGKTYSSLTHAFCENKCFNINVEEKYPGPCRKETFENKYSFMDFLMNIKPHIYVRLTGPQQQCITKCPATIVKQPVCGTDGVTYENPVQVDCARNCYNPDLSVDYQGACRYSLANELKECACQAIESTPFNPPVCGSDGRTYPNAQALECLKNCKHDQTLTKFSDSSC